MSIDVDIRNMRRDYKLSSLDESNLTQNPLDLFNDWLNEAINIELKEPNAMALSTISNNKPKTRIVLLKQILDGNFVFFTNYNSNKGKEIAQNPNVAITFFWEELQRQVRIEGFVQKSSPEISDNYFKMRAKESQIAAWVSNQSQEMTKEELEKNLEFYTDKFKNMPVLRPPHWGAYEINPSSIEFWQGGANRLHDRIIYEKSNEIWKKKRLGP